MYNNYKSRRNPSCFSPPQRPLGPGEPPPRPCVLSTQPTVPSLLPAPPVTYGTWQAEPGQDPATATAVGSPEAAGETAGAGDD